MRPLLFLTVSLAVLCASVMGADSPAITHRIPKDYVLTATPQMHAVQIEAVIEAETDLGETDKDWISVSTGGTEGVSGFQKIPAGWNAVSLMCYAYGDGTNVGDPNAGTISFSVYLADWYGGAKTVYKGTAAVGNVQLATNPVNGTTKPPLDVNDFLGTADPNYCWVDTITAATGNPSWKGSVGFTVSGGAGGETGSNIASLDGDLFGGYYICVKTTAMANVSAVVWIMKPDF